MFLHIGDIAININHIEYIQFEHESNQVFVYTIVIDDNEQTSFDFSGSEYNAFMNWWEHKAEVYRA